jgi:hypothetical protein
MSLDLILQPPKCETCGHEPEGLSFNITYNLSPMWYALYPDDSCMLKIEELNGIKSLKKINKYIGKFKVNKEMLTNLNPPNGWGSYDHFVKTLRAMRDACEEHPDWIWSANR